MQSIVDKNNEGVRHIRDGCYSDAKKAFKTALLYLTVFHQQHQGEDFSPGFAIRIETTTLPESTNPASSTHSFYVYQDAYLAYVETSATSKEKPTQDENSCCMAVLITFNLSLALHYKLDTANGGELLVLCRKKLLRFYKKAWEALQISTLVIPGHRTYRDTIALAILNNTGIIYYYSFWNSRKARFCFESLKNMLSCEKDENNIITALMPKVRNGLMMNIFLLVTQDFPDSDMGQKNMRCQSKRVSFAGYIV